MPLQATSGAASYDAFGGGVAAVPQYIEDVFGNFLYTGTGATQTITNGIDLAGKGGLVWIKSRAVAGNHFLMDTARGFNTGVSPAAAYKLSSDSTSAQGTSSELTAFNSNGFTLGSSWVMNDDGSVSGGNTYASWTFRKQPKFFDVVTYTGNGVAGREISHALGSVPGFVIVKKTSAAGLWATLHKDTNLLYLERTNAAASASTTALMFGDDTSVIRPTSTVFTVGSADNVNTSGETYVAYLFAHDAGGFGLTGTDNVISCGSFTTDGNGTIPATTLGYEPQYVMFKASSTTGAWTINDTMRGQPTPVSANASAPDATLYANNSSAESQADNLYPTATGFKGVYAAVVPSTTYIYIAIRRGPMKVPTSGTSVFSPISATPTSGPKTTFTTNFSTDLIIERNISNSDSPYFVDRLRGGQRLLNSSATDAESSSSPDFAAKFDSNTNVISQIYSTGYGNIIGWNFRRAPSFFDEVCYTGTGSARTLSHNLQAVPELILLKDRNNSAGWAWYYGVTDKWISMPGGSAPFTSSTIWNDTSPTSSVFSVGANSRSNASGTTYVAYLWASLAGVSKIGTYVGNGSSQTINCGFTSGARFVLITNLTDGGRWNVFDTARGINSASDPVLRLDTTTAEITGEDPIDPDSSGFIVNVGGPDYTFINNSGTTYLYLAIA